MEDEMIELGPLKLHDHEKLCSDFDLTEAKMIEEATCSPASRLEMNSLVQAQILPNVERSLVRNGNDIFVKKCISADQEKVQTQFGLMTVSVAGDRNRPAILTFHDLGLNANSCFQSFFQFSEMSAIAEHFCVYHVNAPGQESDAALLPDSFVYPTMAELAQTLVPICDHFNIKSFIGFGVGVGSNILCRYALSQPKKVDALILVNCTAKAAGWMEWGYQKVNSRYLRTYPQITNFTVDYLMWHHFGRHLDSCNQDLINSYRHYFARMTNLKNLAAFIDNWTARTPLPIMEHSLRRSSTVFGSSTDGGENMELRCPVMQLVGWDAAQVNDTVDLNSKLDPRNSNWIKVSDASGLVLEDAPEKVTEAIVLFLQGLGYLPALSHIRWVQQAKRSSAAADNRKNSLDSSAGKQARSEHGRSSFAGTPGLPRERSCSASKAPVNA